MKLLLLVAVTMGLATAKAQDSNDERPDGFACLQQRAFEQKNKQIVASGYQAVLGDHNISAVDEYFHPDYIQHNPGAADGAEGLKVFAGEWARETQKEKLDFRRVSAEGDLVWVHLKARGPGGKDLAIMDVFRVENGKIIEHWDVIQSIPELENYSKNPHPFF